MNAPDPMLWSVEGKDTSTSPLQPLKAKSPMRVTPSGSWTKVMPVQRRKAIADTAVTL